MQKRYIKLFFSLIIIFLSSCQVKYLNNKVKIKTFTINQSGVLTFEAIYVSDSTIRSSSIQPGLDGPDTEILYFGIPKKVESNYIDINCNWHLSDFVKNFNDKKYVAWDLERYSTRFCFLNDDDVNQVILVLKDRATGSIDTLFNNNEAKPTF